MTDIATLVKCTIPANPDIAGIGVRTAIYVQNFLCIIPAIAALWDGKVTQGELDYAEMQTTTNLVLAFAILISSIVQARTLGMTNYHANIVLLMSWMNNTNAFIYFILYIHHKLGPSEQKERVDFSWKSWVTHVKERFSCTCHILTLKNWSPTNTHSSKAPPETLSQMTRQVGKCQRNTPSRIGISPIRAIQSVDQSRAQRF
ncbi:hypothetical protein BKA70DRAFT_1103741 [Coprinopsis sp. MPI-PUGE-AT-0042]|nr:hypothetical protein BKA70DRAFT_1117235 [Coprinopsis sp. MPI-PUGE-AT-0042]KAH6908286.1 hypothetical protein BKA70DRAFT_1103741 [Coprinopsis sp. MPI-PUGE-AT-0042]